jgi:hypothetical protein
MLVGQAEEWCGNTANADEQFETAIRILEQLSTPELLRDAHMAYAELLELARTSQLQRSIGKWQLKSVSSAPHWDRMEPFPDRAENYALT